MWLGIGMTFILLLSSCSSLGPRYSEKRDEISRVDEGVARIIVLRTDAHSEYWGRSTPIEVNDENIASCPKGGFVYFDVELKPFKLSVETWDYPGECALLITPTERKTSSNSRDGGRAAASPLSPLIMSGS